MATGTAFNSFVEAAFTAKHDFATDQLVVALCAEANAPVVANTKLVDLTEISYTYASTRNLTTDSATQTSGVLKVIVEDLTVTATGGNVGPFRYVAIYNDTSTDDLLIQFYDLGSEITLIDGQSMLFDFNQTDGLIKLNQVV